MRTLCCFASQVVGRCRETICIIWEAKADAGKPGAEDIYSQSLLLLKDVFHSLSWGQHPIFYLKYRLPPRTSDSFLITHHLCRLPKKPFQGSAAGDNRNTSSSKLRKKSLTEAGLQRASPASELAQARHRLQRFKQIVLLRLFS